MYKVITVDREDGFKDRTLVGEGEEDGEITVENPTKLNCRDLTVKRLVLQSGNIGILENGPKKADLFYAKCCGITGLDYSYAEITNFFVYENFELKSLKGCPKVTETLSAYNCSIEELDCSEMSLDNFELHSNQLKSLANGPKKARMYDVSNNRLETLDCPELEVGEIFNISSNNLKSLANGPKSVLRYDASDCCLQTLDCPELQVSRLLVQNNYQLCLRGCPKADFIKVSEDIPLLFAVGKVEKVIIEGRKEYSIMLGDTIFRTKLNLIQSGQKEYATFYNERPSIDDDNEDMV